METTSLYLTREDMRWLVQMLRDEVDMGHSISLEYPYDPSVREHLVMSRRVLGILTAQLITNAYPPNTSEMEIDPSLN